MNRDKRASQDGSSLRKQAEAVARQTTSPEQLEALSHEDTRQVLHELRVHQIELETQNEELRRTQLELEASRARYFDLYELAPVSYCTVSEQGLILQANLTAATLFGVARGALLQQPFRRFILKADQDIYYLCRKRLMETLAPQACELRLLHADGAPRWVRLTSTVSLDDTGATVLRIVLTDITERVLAQQKIRKSEERYRNLFTSIDEGFCIIEVLFNEHQKPLDYRFLEINPSFEAQSGLRDATGKRMRELSPVHEEYWFEIYGKVALTGDPIRLVKEAKSLGRWFDVYAFSVDDPALHQVAVLFHDITERRRFEGELTTARTTAEAANVAKSVFLSNMSHELRTPLSAILGFAQLLDSGAPAPTPPQKKSLDQILRAGWHLLDLINEILDLALIESGKLSMSIESVSLHEVLLECQAMIESQAQGRGIKMRFPSLAENNFVEADRLRLKQILLNLLSNAIKYNKANGEVTVACAKPSPDRLRISVADTGEGLTPEQVAKLFEPFNRLGQERGTKEGTGIGLVVCKQLVELMGGVIGVESTVGVGSTFWFELNLTPETLDPSGIPGALAQSKPHSLLYIEDDPTNLSLVEVLLRHHPTIRLLSAVDGWSGVTLARSSQPDVILMDINLPGMSGLEALKLLQSDPLTAHIPVLAISADATPDDIKRGLDAGFRHYLAKPLSLKVFMAALEDVLCT